MYPLAGRRTACLAKLVGPVVCRALVHMCGQCLMSQLHGVGEKQLPLLEDMERQDEHMTVCTDGALLLHGSLVPSAADADADAVRMCMHCFGRPSRGLCASSLHPRAV